MNKTFADLLKNKQNLSTEEYQIVKELLPTYNKIKFNSKEQLTIKDLMEIKSLRSSYSYDRIRANSKIEGLEKANTANGKQFLQSLAKTFPSLKTLSQIDNLSNVYNDSVQDYLDKLRNAEQEVREFVENKNNSSVRLKQWMKSNPSNREIGTVNFLMSTYNIAAYSSEDIEMWAYAFEAVREYGEMHGIKDYKGQTMNVDNSLKFQEVGRLLKSGEKRKAYNLVKKLYQSRK